MLLVCEPWVIGEQTSAQTLTFRLPLCENIFPQSAMMHWKRLLGSCTALWAPRFPRWANAFPHVSHTKGFSPL